MAENNCFLCCESETKTSKFLNLTVKGLQGIISASKIRKDNICELLGALPEHRVNVHVECRRVYTNPNNVKSSIKPEMDTQDEVPTSCSRVLRSNSSTFTFKEHCLFCGHFITESDKRLKSGVIQVRTVMFKNSIMKACNSRHDVWSANVQSRLLSVSDLPAAGAKYHQACSVNFRKGDPIPKRYQDEFQNESSCKHLGRPAEKAKHDAFLDVCQWFQENDEPVSVQQLVTKMEDFLTTGNEPYSSRHMLQKLEEHFADNIIVIKNEGMPTMVAMGQTAANILLDYHRRNKLEDSELEKYRLIEAAAKLIKTEIKRLSSSSMEYYSSSSEIASEEENKRFVPPVLQHLLDIIIGKKSCDLKKISIGQAVVQASRPRSFISPILLGVGVQLHRDFGSRLLVEQLYRLGFSVSYDEVKRYLHSSIINRTLNVEVPPGHFCQWIADNVDHNIATTDGHNTFHGMGIIMCKSGPPDEKSNILTERKIHRLKTRLSAADVFEEGKIDIRYFQSQKLSMNKIVFDEMHLNPIEKNNVDLLWHTSKLLKTPRTGWNGYMQNIMVSDEHTGAVSTTFLPMINMNPTTHSCVYTTLKFICSQAEKLNIPVPVITFDQCLWIKAMEVVCSKPEEFPNILIRLGGFHTLISFLGTIGQLLSGSGIEEALKTIYAENTVSHMLTGKAYSRAVRGHIMLSSALTSMLLQDVLDSNLKLPAELLSEEQVELMDTDEVQQTLPNLQSFTELFDKLYSGEVTVSEIDSSTALQWLSSKLEEKTCSLKVNCRTAKLWIMYLEMVDITKLFILAERTGNLRMHLQAVEHMLPFFAAAGHNNYAKCARVYLQQMRDLENTHKDTYRMLSAGHFTIRRHSRLWAGVWTDMFIEQTLMRSTKSRGGLTRGRGMGDSQRSSWILSHPACCEVIFAMSNLTNVSRVSSEQHIEMTDARKTRDLKDFQTILQFLEDHNPFNPQCVELCNVYNGLVDSENKVTVDEAKAIGLQIHSKMNGKGFNCVTMVKKDQAVTMKILKKGIVIDGVIKHIDTGLLTQRMLVCLHVNPDLQELKDNFKYELSILPPSLFDPETQLLRKSNKSSLARTLDDIAPTSNYNLPAETSYILDGGALLHKLPWPRVGKFSDVLELYSRHISNEYKVATVVFDGYINCSTKDVEHQRRTKQSSVTVKFTESSPLLIGKGPFLSNNENKQCFITMLGKHLEAYGHTVIHATDDADTVIVKSALTLAEQKHVTVVADDTDILVLLIYHNTRNICLQSCNSDKKRDIKTMQKVLGEKGCKIILFSHAITGCDTTSSLYGKSKSAAYRHFLKYEELTNCATLFGSANATRYELTDIGSKALVSLYGGNPNTETLNQLRHNLYIKKITTAKSEFNIARLPPTEDAAVHHLRRVHLQCCYWKTLNTNAGNPEEWGWKKVGNQLQPITCEMEPAPDKLLHMIRCTCKTTTNEPCDNGRCTCRRYGVECTELCSHCSGRECTNSALKDIEIEEMTEEF